MRKTSVCTDDKLNELLADKLKLDHLDHENKQFDRVCRKADDAPPTVPTADFGLNEFRQRACETVHYVADYLENIGQRKVFPEILPGYLAPLIPEEAPEYPDSWEDIMKDVERVIMPGVS